MTISVKRVTGLVRQHSLKTFAISQDQENTKQTTHLFQRRVYTWEVLCNTTTRAEANPVRENTILMNQTSNRCHLLEDHKINDLTRMLPSFRVLHRMMLNVMGIRNRRDMDLDRCLNLQAFVLRQAQENTNSMIPLYLRRASSWEHL